MPMQDGGILSPALNPGRTSTVNLAEGFRPQLGGTLLYVGLADGADWRSMLHQTFRLFGWNGPLAEANRFAAAASDSLPPGYSWDFGDLYAGDRLSDLLNQASDRTPVVTNLAIAAPNLAGWPGPCPP